MNLIDLGVSLLDVFMVGFVLGCVFIGLVVFCVYEGKDGN